MIKKIYLCLIAFILFTGCSSENSKPLAQLEKVTGSVEFRATPGDSFKSAKSGLGLIADSSIRTGEDGEAILVFAIGGKMKLSSRAFFQLKSDTIIGKQTSGTCNYEINKQHRKISIETPQGFTAVLGTSFQQIVTEESLAIELYEGSIEFTDNSGTSIKINPSEKLLVETGKKPGVPTRIDATDENVNEAKTLGDNHNTEATHKKENHQAEHLSKPQKKSLGKGSSVFGNQNDLLPEENP